jgi:hypothetical protein
MHLNMNTSTDSITKQDFDRIEASLKQVIEVAKQQKIDAKLGESLDTLSQSIQELKVTVNFDHEQRLKAIEEYLIQGM